MSDQKKNNNPNNFMEFLLEKITAQKSEQSPLIYFILTKDGLQGGIHQNKMEQIKEAKKETKEILMLEINYMYHQMYKDMVNVLELDLTSLEEQAKTYVPENYEVNEIVEVNEVKVDGKLH